MQRRYITAIGGVTLVMVLAVGAWLWLTVGESRVSAEGDCADADEVDSYDLTIHWDEPKESSNFTDSNSKSFVRIQGKMNHIHSTWTEGGRELSSDEIYDGDTTVYRRQHWATTYEQDKSDRYPDIRDMSEEPFPYGRKHLCPDVEELGAEYLETDEIGKKYRIDAEKVQDSMTFWIDDDGWLLRADEDGLGSHITISGIGEHNSITIPAPPYRGVDVVE